MPLDLHLKQFVRATGQVEILYLVLDLCLEIYLKILINTIWNFESNKGYLPSPNT